MTNSNICWFYSEDENHEFTEIGERQIDPLTSEQLGYEVYLMPAFATDVPVIEEKEDCIRCFDLVKNEWFYKEIEKEPEPEPYVPTERDILNQELWTLKNELASTDYKAIKYAEGWISEEDYAPIKTQRQHLRDEINRVQAEIDALDD